MQENQTFFRLIYAAWSFANAQGLRALLTLCCQQFLCRCKLAAPVSPLEHQPQEPFSGEWNCSSEDHKINDTHDKKIKS